ncbi:MAG: amino acid ABC transporter permease [Lachnospiraceae bacterium]
MERLIDITINSLGTVFMAGLLMTIPLSLLSFGIGLVIATATALMRISKYRVLQEPAKFYVWIFRGTPLLVQLFIVFYGLPSIGIKLNAFPAAIIAFSLNVGAYCSETIRSSILSVNKGQWEAAYAIGMTKNRALWRIIVPQSLRVSVPPLSNSFIGLVKDTSLAANITVVEVFMTTQRIAARTYEPMMLYCIAALIYLVFSSVLVWVQGKIELTLLKKY